MTCVGCKQKIEPFEKGWGSRSTYHTWCEPTDCDCGRVDDLTPAPDAVGQCRNCHRRVAA